MPLQAITRLKPCDLQEVQIQANVTTTGTIANVIQSLQFNRTTVPAPLNTHCPTCMVSDVSQGFVTGTLNGVTVKAVCPTCLGYLKYYTEGGELPAPTNPFNAPLIVKRLLPADLREALNGFPASTTLATMIVSLQANYANPVTFDCPKCTHTGWITVQSAKTICPVCTGLQKTALEMEMNGDMPVIVPVVEPMPDPLPVPTLPPTS